MARRLRMTCVLGLFCALALSQPGCSLFVMAGKMVFGDPMKECAFTEATHVDLIKDGGKVIVVCNVPDIVRNDFPSLNLDLQDGISRRLSRREIDVVKPDDVANWMDEHGTDLERPSELADEFDADYIIYLVIDQYTDKEQGSPSLLRGHALGNLFVYEVRKDGKQKFAQEVFVREFTFTHPRDYPVSADQRSTKVFRKQFTDHVTETIAQMFYNHRVSEEIH